MLINQFLLLGAVLFCIGVYGVIARKNAVLVLMSIELILNSVNINLLAFALRNGGDPAGHVAVDGAEGQQVDVDRVEDQLDRHQHEHGVLQGDDPVDPDAEQDRPQQEELVHHQLVHHRSFRAMTMAPTRAASSSTDTTSNGIRYWAKIESLTVAVFEPAIELISRSAGSLSSPQ